MTDLTLTSTLPLNDKQSHIPQFGFGTCGASTCTKSALFALEQGYIHLDTAQIYQNESETGEALKRYTTLKSQQHVFVCSKLWEDQYGRESALNSVKESCRKLGVEQIDLYLLHTPRPGPKLRHESWLGLQDAMKQGLVKAIGVSNWAPRHVEELMKQSGVEIMPAVNQIEFHPWQQQRQLIAWCKRNRIVIVAYSPLAQGKRLKDPVILEVAKKVGKTPAQVVLRWCLQKDVVVIPKSDREERIKENMGVFDFELGLADMDAIDTLDEGQKGNVGEWDPYAWE